MKKGAGEGLTSLSAFCCVKGLLAAAAATLTLSCCPLQPLAAAAAAAPAAAAAAAAGGDGGLDSGSPPSDFLAGLLESLGGGDVGATGGAGGLPSMQALLEKLTQEFSNNNNNSSSSSGSSSSEDEGLGLDGEEGLDGDMLAKLMKELPSLAQSLHASQKGSKTGGGHTPEGPAGEGSSSFPKELQEMAERLLSESGEDGGLLQHFRALQAATSRGATDLDSLTSAFKGLAESLKEQGTDISSLMSSVFNDPLVQLPPVSPPPGLNKLYKRNLPRPFGDRQDTDLERPPAVSLSAIKSSLATTTQELPSMGEKGGAPQCHALVLSGALARAPLQAGAILGLVEQYKARRQTLRWDVVAGVNKAALSAVISLAFPPGENDELEFALYLWDFWGRVKSEKVLRCPRGLTDLMDLPKILAWLSDSSQAVNAHAVEPARLPLPHLCDTSVYAETAAELLQQLPRPEETAAAAAAAAAGGKKVGGSRRIAAVTAAVVGGGRAVWELQSIGRGDTCLQPRPSVSFVSSGRSVCLLEEGPPTAAASNPKSELDLTLAALVATNATPGVYPIVRVRTMGGPRRGGPRLTGGAPSSLLRKEKAAFADGRLVADLSVEEAIQACMRKVAAEGGEGLKKKELKKGKGIVLDLVGTAPFDETEVDEQLTAIAAKLKITTSSSSSSKSKSSSSSSSKGAVSPKALLKRIRKEYPLLQIRHVLFPEEPFELMSEYADFRGSEALLHHGRLMGWKALTLEDVE
ncbi:hypothetical protein Emed_004500 [Eimeria media]